MEFKKVQSFAFFSLLIAISVIFLWILKPYVYSIFWACVLAVLFYPLFLKINNKCKKKNIAALSTIAVITIIIAIPITIIVSLLIKQAYDVYYQFGNQETFERISKSIEYYLQYPLVQKIIGGINIKSKLIEFGSNFSGFIYSFLARSGQNTLRLIVQFFIMIYALYYFLCDGEKILKKLMFLLPLGDKHEIMLFDKFVATTRATIKGNFIIGLIQGVIGGIAFFIAGVPGSIFWSVIMVVLCIIPNLGTAIILLPGAVILFLIGNIWQAILVLIAMIISSFVDNFLRGPLMKKDVQMHPLLIFFATLGGLLAFGISGVIIGPIITAFFLSVWEIYIEKYRKNLEIDI